MKQISRSLLAAILIIIVLSVALAVFVALYFQAISQPENKQIPLSYRGELTTFSQFPGAYFEIRFNSSKTLFDCKTTISYQAINGTQVVINRNLGLVDSSDSEKSLGFSWSDYPANNQTVHLVFTEANPPDNLHITAYGYEKPLR